MCGEPFIEAGLGTEFRRECVYAAQICRNRCSGFRVPGCEDSRRFGHDLAQLAQLMEIWAGAHGLQDVPAHVLVLVIAQGSY